MVVLHYTAMRTAAAARARLCDPAAEVSAHYLVEESGRVWSLVAEAARAWHAGAGQWGTVADVNSRSIGIELANAGPLEGFPPFPEPQMRALERLLDAICSRWRIAPERVVAHSDVAPGRKADPGAKFDWRRLGRGGRAAWIECGPCQGAEPEECRADWSAFARAAETIGYRAPADDWPAVLTAFRLRFRPATVKDASLQTEDVRLARALALAFPCIDAARALS